MPVNQTYRDVHVDALLSNFSVAHWQDTSRFVGTRFFPIVPVNKASDKYKFYPQGYFNRTAPTGRSEDGVANSIGYKSQERSYSCGDDAIRIFISDRKRANVDSQVNLDREATKVTTDTILLGKEQAFVDTFLTPGKWAKDYQGGVALPKSGTKKWTDDTADPIGDVVAASTDFNLRSGGRRYNKGLITLDVYNILREHPAVLDRVKGGATTDKPAQVMLQGLAELMELDELVIMQSVVNMAVDGLEDSNGNPLVDNQFFAKGKMMLTYTEQTSGLYVPVAAATFVHNDYIPMGADRGPSVRRYRPQDGRKGEFIEAEMSIDQKLVSPDLGELWYDLV